METLREPAPERLDPRPQIDETDSPSFDLSWFTPGRIVRIVEISAVVVAVGFVLGQLGLGNLLSDTTPAGGDMGAHVWGPVFLRDHLLSHGSLSGWTPDWYDGFPAYQFYMVVPALMILALNFGFHGWAGLLPLALVVVAFVYAFRQPAHSTRRHAVVAAAVVGGVLCIGLPYGTSFKLVSVVGVLALPIAAYAFARLADLPFPTPPLFALAMVPFLFNREPIAGGTGNIIGGNLTSTLAGEFSFSISLAFGVLFLGVLVAGLRTGRYRWLGAVLFALTALCHVIVGIFVFIAAVAALIVWPGRARLKWMATALPVGALLSAFWTFPFLARHEYVNDMGWQKLPAGTGSHSWNYLLGKLLTDGDFRADIFGTFLAPTGMRWLLALAVVGLVVSFVLQIRTGLWLGLVTAMMAIAFVIAPESRLWNARLLPFYYLGLCMLAALGIAELGRAIAILVSPDPDQPSLLVNSVTVGLSAVIVVIAIGLPLKLLPGETSDTEGFHWKPLAATVPFTDVELSLPFTISTAAPADPSPFWARWNYTGYEGKTAYPEYFQLVSTMQRVGQENGCGRAMWEYDDPRLERYGTPMAPMLLSLWTDGCIGSMEGLYFESSTTTPFHFINQSELSSQCSCAQRNLPYKGFDMNLGIEHMQLMGVKYYIASTPKAVEAARQHPALHEIAASGTGAAQSCELVGGCAWHVFEIDDSPMVQALSNEPAVVTTHNKGLDWTYGTSDPHTAPLDSQNRTILANGPAMSWYLDPDKWDVFLAADGPSSWARVTDGETPPERRVPKATVSNVVEGTDTIDFDVDKVGTPILVKTSYFPNWKVDGADGPYRVTPNFMVVIPTSNHVHLHYGKTSVEYIAWGLTLLGIALTILLARRPPLRMPPPAPASDETLSRLLEPRDDADDDDDEDPRTKHDIFEDPPSSG